MIASVVILKAAATITTGFVAQDFFKDGVAEGFKPIWAAVITGGIALFIAGAIWL